MGLKKILPGMMLLFLIVLLTGCAKKAQFVTISGQIECDWNSLEGVKVDVGGKAQAISDQYGAFMTGQFPPGTYVMTFSKDGYWTLNFSVTFDKPGNWQFNNTIHISKVISGEGTVEEPALIKDYGSNTRVTIKANNRVNTLIAIPYNSDSWFDPSYSTNLCITSDIGVSSASVTAKQPLTYNRTKNVLEQRLQEYNKKIIPQLRAKGLRPGIADRSFGIKSAEESLDFYKYNFDSYDTFATVNASLKYNGAKCLIYLDNTQSISQSYIDQLGQAFDNIYYDRLIQYFGDLTVNIDNYDKVYILLSNLAHDDTGMIVGYFDSLNEFPESSYPYSNEKEMLYLTTYTYNDNQDAWLELIKAAAAHEFQHLINFSCRKDKEYSPKWINEGLSMMAEDIAIAGPGGHNPEVDDYIKIYLKYHTLDSLQDWTYGDSLDYASAYLFMRYIADRCGEDKLKTLNTTTDYYIGEQTIVNIAGVANFEEIFKDWLTAIALSAMNYSNSDPNFNNKYLYKTIDLSTFDFQKENPGYIYLTTGAGAFVNVPDLDAASRIDVTLSGYYDFKMRLLMIPAAGVSYSSYKAPRIIPLP